MKIHFLGTNGWYDTKTGNTVCILIDTQKYYLILDAGNGIHKADRFIKSNKPVYLFLSHFHLDHIIGLHILNKFNFGQDLRIYGQKGTRAILNRIVNKTFTAPFNKLPFKTSIYELGQGEHHIPFYVKCKFLKHITKCLGYRFELEGKVITYCTDTAFCKNAVELARNADILITECSYRAGQADEKWPHLDPLGAARIAKEAKAKKLILTHFDADVYRTLRERKLAQEESRRVFSCSHAAHDGLVINI